MRIQREYQSYGSRNPNRQTLSLAAMHSPLWSVYVTRSLSVAVKLVMAALTEASVRAPATAFVSFMVKELKDRSCVQFAKNKRLPIG